MFRTTLPPLFHLIRVDAAVLDFRRRKTAVALVVRAALSSCRKLGLGTVTRDFGAFFYFVVVCRNFAGSDVQGRYENKDYGNTCQ